MSWNELHLAVPRELVEPLEEALQLAGALSITLGDEGEQPILEPGVGETPLWPEVHVSALFSADCDREAITRELAVSAPGITGRWSRIEDRAWEREWLAHFRPMRFGQRLWVCPHGQEPEGDDAVVLHLDPGLAFGTGTHPSTALCLEWLDANAPRGLRVVDFGCGSGILGLAALLLGARSVRAVDIDPQALQATRENAARNNLLAGLGVGEPGVLEGEQADLLLANILAGPLMDLAPRFANLLPAGARALLAGILHHQCVAIRAAYEPWFELREVTRRDEWCSVELLRKDDPDA